MWRRYANIKKLLVLISNKSFSTTSITKESHSCKLLVVGGGCAGCNIASRFSRVLKKHEIIIVEPSQVHYYQPYFTLVGTGIKKLRDSVKTTVEVLPQDVTWLQDSVEIFCPHINAVMTKNGDIIEYEFMVVAVGVKIKFDLVSGLTEALNNYRNVSTIFSSKYVEKTFKCLKEFVSGTALFTAPKRPAKCLAAAFKICFIAHDYFKREDKLFETDMIYATAQNDVFPVKEYEKTILEVADRKRVHINLKTNLIEIIPDRNEAVFECLNSPGTTICMKYNMLHVTPPMLPPKGLRECKELVDKYKYVDIDLNTLQHKKYPNVFALGDCSPGTSNKTVSATTCQALVVFRNLSSVMHCKKLDAVYDGYTGCPIVTGYGTCLLAEFDYDMKIYETFPFNQNIERQTMYYLKKDIMPYLYWKYILKGKYSGLGSLRKIMRVLRLK